jgi:hypothetical protein
MFDEAFALADEASLSLMGEDVNINALPVRVVRDEGEYFSQLGDGGFIGTRNCTFYLQAAEAARVGAVAGSRVVTSSDAWSVNVLRSMGTMTALICISTSGQSAAEF